MDAMLRLTPILLAILYAWLMYRFSVWRTARELDAKSAPLDDPRLNSLLARMALALGLGKINVHIYDVQPVNGLAAPDGRIFLTRGFMDKYRLGEVSAEELASVVAHELGHVALGHARRRMIDFSGQNAIRTALAMVLGRFSAIVLATCRQVASSTPQTSCTLSGVQLASTSSRTLSMP